MIRNALVFLVLVGSSALAQPPETGVGARGVERRDAGEPAPPIEPRTETAPPPTRETPTPTPTRETPSTTPTSIPAQAMPSQTPASPPTEHPAPTPEFAPSDPAPPVAEEPPPEPTPIATPAERSPQPAREAVEPTRAAEPIETAAPSEPTNVFIPVPMEAGNTLWDELHTLEGMFGRDGTKGGLLLLFLELLICIALAFGLRRMRDWLPTKGLIPATLAILHLLARLLVVAIAIAIIARGLPPRAMLVLLLAFVGFALALGWSSRDVLPDMIAGFVLAFERRIRTGMWIRSEDFAGQVEAVGIRSTLIRDAQGRQVAIPNRHLLRRPVTSDLSHELEQDVLLRIESDAPAERIRLAIRDAVLSSPWVLPGADPIVLRDPDDAWIWRVRSRLLAMRFAVAFEGELLERAEEMLAAYHPHPAPKPLAPESKSAEPAS